MLFPEQLVGNIDGCQNGNPVGGDNGGIAGDLAHALVDKSRNFLNIFGIGATLESVLLAEDGYCHAFRFQLGPLPAKGRAPESTAHGLTHGLQFLEKISDLVFDFLPLLLKNLDVFRLLTGIVEFVF